MKKILALILAALMIVSLMVGCSKSDSTDKPTNNAAPESSSTANTSDAAETVYKDTITIATSSDQNYMDGQMNNTNDVYLRAVYSQLVRRSADNDIIGDLAERWDVSEDGCTWTFYLKHGIKFHSGKELTAKDVKASYDRLLDTENPVRYNSLATGYISACNMVDDYTVELVTPSPIAPMLANLTHRSNLILNEDYIEKYGAELGLTVESVDGTGPYKLAKWDKDNEMVLERFDDYFGGVMPTKTIDILIVADANARQVALETGEIDMSSVTTSQVPLLKETPGVKIWFFDSIAAHGLQFNCANEYLKDTRLRQAVSYAIDRQAIIDALYSDVGETAATAPVNPRVWGYHNFGVIEQDQEKAKQLMADAGYPDGFSFSIQVCTTYNKSLETCEMVVSDLAKVGITATIETVDNATFSACRGSRSYPGEDFPWGMFFMGYGAGTADCDEGLRRIWETSPDGNNNNNYGWYSNAEVDELLEKAAVEMDEATRLELYKQAQQILYIDDPAAVWTNDRLTVWATTDKVEGLKLNVNSVIFWDELRCAQ